jgi:hypothetical protein
VQFLNLTVVQYLKYFVVAILKLRMTVTFKEKQSISLWPPRMNPCTHGLLPPLPAPEDEQFTSLVRRLTRKSLALSDNRNVFCSLGLPLN